MTNDNTVVPGEKKVRLYLDVDGVINAHKADARWAGSRIRRGRAGPNPDPAYKYVIQWSKDLVDALKGLDVELVWTTTWVGHAPTEIAPLIGYGYNARWLEPEGGVTFPSILWKNVLVWRDQQTDPSPYIWIDDELGDLPMLRVMGADDLDHSRGLLISPNPRYGITPDDILDMKKYIEANS